MKLFIDMLWASFDIAILFVAIVIIIGWYKEKKKPKFYVIDCRKINKP